MDAGRGFTRVVAVIVVATLFASCGSNDSPNTPSPPASGLTVFLGNNQVCQAASRCTVTGNAPANGWVIYAVNPPEPFTGTVNAVLTWADGSTNLDLYIGNGPCPNANSCAIDQASTATTGTREAVADRLGIPFLVYAVLVNNRSPRASAYTLEITIS